MQPNFWRALTDNDVANNHLERCGIWKFAGKNAKLQSIDLKEDSNKQLATVTVNYKLEAQESTLQTVYQVRPNGAVKVSMHFVPGNKSLPEMPRLGMRMILPAEYDVMTWLGRGPQEKLCRPQDGLSYRALYRYSMGTIPSVCPCTGNRQQNRCTMGCIA